MNRNKSQERLQINKSVASSIVVPASKKNDRKRSAIDQENLKDNVENKKRPRLDVQNQEIKDRGKRMLGMIFNTLNQFKKDTSKKSEAEKRREELENKLQQRLKKEKKELEEKVKQDDEIRKKKRTEEEKIRMEKMQSYWDKQNIYKANFIKTKANPNIYYLPAKLNNETRKILEEQKKEILKTIKSKESIEKDDHTISTVTTETTASKTSTETILDNKDKSSESQKTKDKNDIETKSPSDKTVDEKKIENTTKNSTITSPSSEKTNKILENNNEDEEDDDDEDNDNDNGKNDDVMIDDIQY